MGAQQLPHTRRFPRALLGAETCAGGWGLPLRVWAHAQSPSSGEQPLTKTCRRRSGKAEAAQPRAATNHAWADPRALPVRQSSSSAQSPDLAEFLERGSFALDQHCPDLPRC